MSSLFITEHAKVRWSAASVATLCWLAEMSAKGGKAMEASADEQSQEHLYKILVIGDFGVGKQIN